MKLITKEEEIVGKTITSIEILECSNVTSTNVVIKFTDKTGCIIKSNQNYCESVDTDFLEDGDIYNPYDRYNFGLITDDEYEEIKLQAARVNSENIEAYEKKLLIKFKGKYEK